MLEKYPVYFHMIPMSLTRDKRKKNICNNEKLFNHICIQSNLLMLLSILREYYILAHSLLKILSWAHNIDLLILILVR
jgi:hypothetical protein